MNIKEINRQIQGGRIQVKAFLGAKSIQLNPYVTHYWKNIVMMRPSYMLVLTISEDPSILTI